jgi:pre-mRNA-processing factor 6
VGLGVDEEDQLRTWLDDADTCLEKRPPMVRTARAIYEHALQAFSEDWGLWMASCVLEKEHGDPAVLQAQLERAVTHCPQAEVLWLMAAKEKWAAGDVAGSRALLTAAFEANPNSEKIWLAAIKLEWENGEAARAALLLGKAREKAPSPRVWMKSAVRHTPSATTTTLTLVLTLTLLFTPAPHSPLPAPRSPCAQVMAEEMGEIEACLRLADQAIQRYPTFTKLYMLAGQASERSDGGIEADLARARGYYQAGLAQSASAPADAEPLWLLLAALEERHKGAARARSTLEMARLKLPASERVWLESVRLERRSGSEQLATSLGAKALRVRVFGRSIPSRPNAKPGPNRNPTLTLPLTLTPTALSRHAPNLPCSGPTSYYIAPKPNKKASVLTP